MLGIGAKDQDIYLLLSHSFQFFNLHTHWSSYPESLSVLQWENVLTIFKSQAFLCHWIPPSLIAEGLAPTLFLLSFKTPASLSPLHHSCEHKTCSMVSQPQPKTQDKPSLHSLIPSRATFPDFTPQQKFMHFHVPFTLINNTLVYIYTCHTYIHTHIYMKEYIGCICTV